jgi:hypothetical protein
VAGILQPALGDERFRQGQQERWGKLREPLFGHLAQKAEGFGPAARERQRPRELPEQRLFPIAVAGAAGVGDALLEHDGGFFATIALMEAVAEVVVRAKGRRG